MMVKNKIFFFIFFLVFLFIFNFSLAQKNKTQPNRYLDTIITNNPPKIIEDNNIKFTFSGFNLSKPNEKIRFQIKLWPLDKDWQDYYYSEKTYYNLPKGRNFYLFYVRSVNDKNEHDPLPALHFFETRISPFYKDVSIDTSYDGLTLTLYNKTNKEINITGWKIYTSRIVYTISQGVKIFNYDFNKVKQEDIILTPYGKAIIKAVYSSLTSTPLGLTWDKIPRSPYGFNFLNNKCFIYINPDLSDYSCDRLYFDQNKLLEMVLGGKISSQCAVILNSADCDGKWLLKRSLEINDFRCQIIIENWYNYNSCFQRRSTEKDFFGNTWRIYFDPRSDHDKQNRKQLDRIYRDRYERIIIYDENFLFVNDYKIF